MRHAGERCAISLLPIVRATAYDVRACRLPISPENIKMRLITFIVAIIAASAPADAQSWREYEYPNEGFTAAFPAEPKVETTSYQASGGRLVEARVYSVVQEGGEFKVTVADLSHTEMSEGNVMAYAVMMLSRGGEIKLDIPHSTRRIIGRQASIDGVDGSQTYASVFFHNRRLYQIEGTVPAGGSTADAIRFQQSFDFTDGWRLPDALRVCPETSGWIAEFSEHEAD
jgi:hypothetical protein